MSWYIVLIKNKTTIVGHNLFAIMLNHCLPFWNQLLQNDTLNVKQQHGPDSRLTFSILDDDGVF